jgi:hypothetical protein
MRKLAIGRGVGLRQVERGEEREGKPIRTTQEGSWAASCAGVSLDRDCAETVATVERI